jgi:hypothetical protein
MDPLLIAALPSLLATPFVAGTTKLPSTTQAGVPAPVESKPNDQSAQRIKELTQQLFKKDQQISQLQSAEGRLKWENRQLQEQNGKYKFLLKTVFDLLAENKVGEARKLIDDKRSQDEGMRMSQLAAQVNAFFG